MKEKNFEVGELLGVLVEELRSNALTAGLAVVILVAGNLALDRLGSTSAMAPAGFLSLAVQLYVLRAALTKAGQPPEMKSKFLSFWGMCIITGIGIILGCLLLVIPGLYLAARWSIAGPAIIAEDLSAGEGMRASWDRTRGSAWPIAGALLLVVGGGFAAAMVPPFLFPGDVVPVGVQAVSYFFAFGGSVCGWLMAVGVYDLLSRHEQSLAEVFA